MSFDFMKARRAFEEYLNEYDRDDEKIKLKIVWCSSVCGGNRKAHGTFGRRYGACKNHCTSS